jgi:hypothetical protein
MADRTIQEKVESVREPDDVERNGNGAPESPVESAEEQAEAPDPEEHEENRFEMVIQFHANESAPQKPEKEAQPESRKRFQIHGKLQEEVDLIGINCVHAKAQSLFLPDIPCEIVISDHLRSDMTSVNCPRLFQMKDHRKYGNMYSLDCRTGEESSGCSDLERRRREKG